MLNGPRNPVLQSLEDVAALSKDSGLISIRPFRDWVHESAWSKKLFNLRLCNAGEVLEIASYLSSVPENARDYALKLETILRMIYKIDGKMIADNKEVSDYCKQVDKELSRIEYLRLWVVNLEGIVVERLYSIYEQMQAKQVRLINGQYSCEVTGNIYNSIPEDAVLVQNCLGEIISKEGLNILGNDLTLYQEDIINESLVEEMRATSPAEPNDIDREVEGSSFVRPNQENELSDETDQPE